MSFKACKLQYKTWPQQFELTIIRLLKRVCKLEPNLKKREKLNYRNPKNSSKANSAFRQTFRCTPDQQYFIPFSQLCISLYSSSFFLFSTLHFSFFFFPSLNFEIFFLLLPFFHFWILYFFLSFPFCVAPNKLSARAKETRKALHSPISV